MSKDNHFWDITDRPHTERKLRMLEKYLLAWGQVIFSQWKENPRFKTFQTIYFVDCFAGRGKYHKDGKENVVNGSPLIALKAAKELQSKFDNKVKLKCIFVEESKKNAQELENFCLPFRGGVEYKILNTDVNKIMDEIIKEIGSNAALFFIDPFSLSSLNKSTIQSIINKKGGKDIILNYICGTNRVIGAIEKMFREGTVSDKTYRLIDSIAKFHSLPVIGECLDVGEVDRLKYWAEEIFKDSDLTHRAIYEMTSSSRKEPVYYLLFASRKEVAKKIMSEIFAKEDMSDYNGQQKLFQTKLFD